MSEVKDIARFRNKECIIVTEASEIVRRLAHNKRGALGISQLLARVSAEQELALSARLLAPRMSPVRTGAFRTEASVESCTA